MPTTEIPHDQWSAFCAIFSREHHGWLASLGEVDTALLDRDPQQARQSTPRLFENAPLQRVERLDENDQIVIEALEQGRVVRSAVAQPRRVVMETEAGGHKGLRIDDAAGMTTLLEFRVPAAPEALDGIAESEFT